MFIHIGNNISVLTDEIVGIFDMEIITTMKDSREFLKTCEEEEFIENVMREEMPKTVIVTQKQGRTGVYLSPISVSTIRKRINMSC